MTVLSDYIDRLVEAGISQSDAMQMVAEIFAAGVASHMHGPSKAALRTRKWRHKTSQNVTSDAQTDETENVTKRHKASQNVTSDNTPLSSLNKDLRKRGDRLSPDWSPSPDDRSFAKQLGWSDAQIDSEAGNFRDYWIAKPGAGGCKLDWPATWRKWIRSSKVKPAGNSSTTIQIPRNWDVAAKTWFRFRSWPKNYGPDPDSPSCECPREILSKHLEAG